MDGQKITSIRTLKSMYDNDCVLVEDGDGNEYRMPCSTIIQMVNEFEFDVEKKRKHKYLCSATCIFDEYGYTEEFLEKQK